jgi:large subunit ribosomal protein L10e
LVLNTLDNYIKEKYYVGKQIRFTGVHMARKPNRMYRHIRGPNNTRKEYMGGIPASRITQFDLGLKDNARFSHGLTLVAKESVQIRHNALEAARIAANKYIQKRAGAKNYHLKIRVYPHQVLRENKQATGAGADRISQGMRASFGKAVSTASRVHRGQKIMTLYFDKPYYESAKKALWKAGQKLPSPCSIVDEEWRKKSKGPEA